MMITELRALQATPRTDYVILTDEATRAFEEPIFRIFRKINMLE